MLLLDGVVFGYLRKGNTTSLYGGACIGFLLIRRIHILQFAPPHYQSIANQSRLASLFSLSSLIFSIFLLSLLALSSPSYGDHLLSCVTNRENPNPSTPPIGRPRRYLWVSYPESRSVDKSNGGNDQTEDERRRDGGRASYISSTVALPNPKARASVALPYLLFPEAWFRSLPAASTAFPLRFRFGSEKRVSLGDSVLPRPILPITPG